MKISNVKNVQDVFNFLHEAMYIADKNTLINYWNPEAERITGYTSSEITGKQTCKKLLLHVDSNGQLLCDVSCPILASLSENKICEAEVYLHHKEGHRIPVSARTIPLHDDQNNIIAIAHLFHDNSPRFLIKELESLENIATIDPLTGLRNRRYAEIKINSKLNEVKAGAPTFGVLFIDIDHFKNVNDTYGHDVGDLVLKMVAKTLLNNTRESDILVRWGGEEIVAIITNADIQTKLLKITHKLHSLIGQSSLPLPDGRGISVTVSIGATVALPSDTIESVIKRTDQLMYQCKEEGRNRFKVQGT